MIELRLANTAHINWKKAAMISGLFALIIWASFIVPLTVAQAAESDLETFKLADQSNLRELSNGDFLFRLARDKKTGVVYWAYNGMTRDVIATIPDPTVLSDDSVTKPILLRVADLPTRVGCGVGLIHRSKVHLVPEDAKYTGRDYKLEVNPLYVVGEVRNDTSGRTPTKLLSYKNFVRRND